MFVLLAAYYFTMDRLGPRLDGGKEWPWLAALLLLVIAFNYWVRPRKERAPPGTAVLDDTDAP
jgi:hypothetical protein